MIYEQPLNERLRVFLRLEYLFEQFAHFSHGNTSWDTHSAVLSLSDILSIFSRMDVKSEVLKELERHAQILGKIQQNPDVDTSKLAQVLAEIETARTQLHAVSGQLDQHLKKSDFVSSIRQRIAIPGGSCSFDLPSYHYWLREPPTTRQELLDRWLSPFAVVKTGIGLVLELIRTSSPSTRETAVSGFFQQSLEGSSATQLIRVEVGDANPFVAEISGGKHRVNIRFLSFDPERRSIQTDQDVKFYLSICGL